MKICAISMAPYADGSMHNLELVWCDVGKAVERRDQLTERASALGGFPR